ncbi:protein FAR1-RELATED SEQUENCE 5 [Sesamum alatum]|uniref:Protein FAR1-RELATED SEQUENCE 5 n=1 Tax=Sesamum alatum TaxID=300844 RepID=A0AAE1XY70_9LAMI|nr:protein FAR1-RELATED SEQUENCE 5 [Sesamum alatum]
MIVLASCRTAVVEGNDNELERGDWQSDDLEEENLGESQDNAKQVEGGEVLEPYVGMEFNSEDDARRFYSDYARKVGFVMRIMQRRRSEVDGKTLARRLGCNNQGVPSSPKGKVGPEKKSRPNSREGCKATILFKLEKSGKWVVTKFIKEHNHPLNVTAHEYTNLRDKDKKIHELAKELQRQEELAAEYRERLVNLLANIENKADHLSSKVLAVVQSVRKAEAEALTVSKA